jgi:hypothetical protein
MATLTAARAAAGFPVGGFAGAGVLNVAYGSYTLAANPTIADVIKFCKIPAGATVIGGWLRGEDIDTGTETLDIDIGWPANGGTGVGATADPDGFGNFGVITGDAVTELKPEASIFLPLNGTLKAGPVSFDAETTIQGVVNAAAAAGGTGVLWLTVLYVFN